MYFKTEYFYLNSPYMFTTGILVLGYTLKLINNHILICDLGFED